MGIGRRGEWQGPGESGKVILGMPAALPSGEGGCQLSPSGSYGKAGVAGGIIKERKHH